MTYIGTSSVPRDPLIQNSYRSEDNESQSISNVISALRDELPTIIEEAQKPLRKELQELRNLFKDEIQQSKQKDEEILALTK